MNIYATADEQNLSHDEQAIINEQTPKKVHVLSLVLSIFGLIFAIFLPIITYPLSIIALVQSRKKRYEFKTTVAFVLSIIGLTIALINSIVGAIMGAMGLL
jgi:cellulose synthase/poly-beta-1,6-N-acetylglucosamine synthase-like glycosyltransferase